MNKTRISIIVITLVIVTLLGVAGQRLLYMQKVERPLKERFLAITGVESFELLEVPVDRSWWLQWPRMLICLGFIAVAGHCSGSPRQRWWGDRNFGSIQSDPRGSSAQGPFCDSGRIATGRFTVMNDSAAQVMVNEGSPTIS